MNKSIGMSWNEFEREHCTPEEIAESENFVKMFSKSFDKMNKGYITHDEAMIETFMEEPEYAEDLLNDVLADGDDYEIQRVKFWYDEAQARRNKTAPKISRWSNVAAVL